MANENQVTLLKQGSEVWNAWRTQHPRIDISLWFDDLSDADLSGVNLSNAYLSNTNLSGADLSGADLSGANLSGANLNGANLSGANLSNAILSDANLVSSTLSDAALSYADLTRATLSNAILGNVDLSYADLSHANLSHASLSKAYLINANLSNANLNAAQLLYANLTRTKLTGACIADWQIGSSTILENIQCNYIFRTYDQQTGQFSGRLPLDPKSTFAPGEFTQRFKIIASALETIDITFTEGIDWQAFFQSFQDLRDVCPAADLSIQGMERRGDAFVVRLEAGPEADKAAIETGVKQRYAQQLAALEAQYQDLLRLQSNEISTYRQTQSSLLHIVQTMAEKDSISQTFHGPVGNVAATNQGQMTAYINQNNEAISQLIAALRVSAQTFPPEQKDDVLMELEDLESDLSKPEKQEPKRISKRLQRLIAAGTAAATLAGGAATFSGNLNEFTDNVLELGEKIGLTREFMQTQ